MERMLFVDPYAAGDPLSALQSTTRPPLPAPPSKLLPAPRALASRGREREVQQLIYDLAVLAAKHQSS